MFRPTLAWLQHNWRCLMICINIITIKKLLILNITEKYLKSVTNHNSLVIAQWENICTQLLPNFNFTGSRSYRIGYKKGGHKSEHCWSANHLEKHDCEIELLWPFKKHAFIYLHESMLCKGSNEFHFKGMFFQVLAMLFQVFVLPCQDK